MFVLCIFPCVITSQVSLLFILILSLPKNPSYFSFSISLPLLLWSSISQLPSANWDERYFNSSFHALWPVSFTCWDVQHTKVQHRIELHKLSYDEFLRQSSRLGWNLAAKLASIYKESAIQGYGRGETCQYLSQYFSPLYFKAWKKWGMKKAAKFCLRRLQWKYKQNECIAHLLWFELINKKIRTGYFDCAIYFQKAVDTIMVILSILSLASGLSQPKLLDPQIFTFNDVCRGLHFEGACRSSPNYVGRGAIALLFSIWW